MSNELGEFLRARRADANLEPPHRGGAGRRRITGLRREEVAAATGISVDYYTRLEQGRETHPSDAVLDSLARVLRLSVDGREHLYCLSRSGSLPRRRPGSDDRAVDERMATLVEAVRPNPAYVLDRLSRMVAANQEGLALYKGFAELAPPDRITCRYLLTDPRAKEIFVEWEDLARGAVAQLRAANADDLRDRELQALVVELSAASPLFSQWWDGHIVERRRTSVRHLRTPEGVVVARRYEVLHLPEDGLRMTLWLPEISAQPGAAVRG